MALSEYEKQILAEMEQHLRQQDPDLADAMAQAAPPATEPVAPKSQLSPRRIALGSILAAAGLAIVLTGVTIGFSVLSVVLGAAGFLMMVGGVLYALSTDKKGKNSADTEAKRPPAQPTPSKKAYREEERRKRWEDRR
ncbi:MAG: DUF3040 domain-containing protein [Scrofimicrobium sp.]